MACTALFCRRKISVLQQLVKFDAHHPRQALLKTKSKRLLFYHSKRHANACVTLDYYTFLPCYLGHDVYLLLIRVHV